MNPYADALIRVLTIFVIIGVILWSAGVFGWVPTALIVLLINSEVNALRTRRILELVSRR